MKQRIIIIGIGILLTGLLTACGSPKTAGNWKPWAPLSEEPSENGQDAENMEISDGYGAEGAQAEGEGAEELVQDTDPQALQELAVYEREQYLCQTAVQIRGTKYLGSGVIWAAEEEYLVIATAAHVTEGNEPLTVQFALGEPLEAELRLASAQVDLAFLQIELEKVQNMEISWQVARQNKEVCEKLAAGEELMIMGSIEETADRIYSGSVTESWIYVEDFDNYMLLGHAYAIPGVSGGGVFTTEGILVGILCGGNDEDEIAVLPWSVMEANYVR